MTKLDEELVVIVSQLKGIHLSRDGFGEDTGYEVSVNLNASSYNKLANFIIEDRLRLIKQIKAYLLG